MPWLMTDRGGLEYYHGIHQLDKWRVRKWGLIELYHAFVQEAKWPEFVKNAIKPGLEYK